MQIKIGMGVMRLINWEFTTKIGFGVTLLGFA